MVQPVVCLGSCPGVGGGGDYNGDGVVDASDADAQAVAMKTPTQNLAKLDENSDGTIDYADRLVWVKSHANAGKGTWVGDADLNGEFNSSDFVTVFTAGNQKPAPPLAGAKATADGNGLFTSGDFVAAFSDGGYEKGTARSRLGCA